MTLFQQIQQGFYFFKQGWLLFFQKGLRRFVIIPLILNSLLMFSFCYFAFNQIDLLDDVLIKTLPDWLSDFAHIFLVVFVFIGFLIFFYFTFTTLAGLIAAPFNGLLAEKVEKRLTKQEKPIDDFSLQLQDIPRILKREWKKITYTLTRLGLLFALSFVPFIGQFFVPILIFIFSAWIQAIQYQDYAFDNHKISFITMKDVLKTQPFLSLTFGFLVMICTFIPFVNFLILPVATCGATAMWVEIYREKLTQPHQTQIVTP